MDTFLTAQEQNFVQKFVSICEQNQYSICLRCIFRYCNVKHVFTFVNYDDLLRRFDSFQQINDNLFCSSNLFKKEQFCDSCLNLLSDDTVESNANQIFKSLSERSISSFVLQISLPVICTLRNQIFCKKFQFNNVEYISIKEVLRVLLTKKLQCVSQWEHKMNSSCIIGRILN